MKTEPNEPVASIIGAPFCAKNNEIAISIDSEDYQRNFTGLTKCEHMAIEFTKALLMNDGYNNVPMATLTKTAIDISKTLIKQLNEDGNTISKT